MPRANLQVPSDRLAVLFRQVLLRGKQQLGSGNGQSTTDSAKTRADHAFRDGEELSVRGVGHVAQPLLKGARGVEVLGLVVRVVAQREQQPLQVRLLHAQAVQLVAEICVAAQIRRSMH